MSIENYFTVGELAKMLKIPRDAARDFLAGHMELGQEDVGILLDRLAEKASKPKPELPEPLVQPNERPLQSASRKKKTE